MQPLIVGNVLILLVALGGLVALSFLPAIIAHIRGHHQRLAILVLNTLGGWTVVGWIAAIVWACTAVAEPYDPYEMPSAPP